MTEDRAVQIVTFLLDHWVALVIGLVVVVVGGIVVMSLAELRKRHLSKRTEDKIEGWVIQKTLAGLSLLMGGLAYALPFLHTYLPVLGSLKYVGGFILSFYGAANYLYAWKGKAWFKALTTYLEQRRDKLAAKKAVSDAQSVQPQPQEQQPILESDSPFEVPA